MTKRPFSLILVTLLAMGTPADAQLAGEWQQTALDQVDTGNPKCVSLWVSQRKMKFTALPDGSFAGIYATSDWAQWLLWQDTSCKLPYTTEPRQGYSRQRFWQLLAVPAGPNRWKIGAQFNQCSFLGCEQQGLFKQSFEVTVELRGSRLLEVEGSAEKFSYRRTSEADAIAGQAELAFKSAVAEFDAGNCVRFYGQRFEPGRIDTRQSAALCQAYENLRQAMPRVTSTDLNFKAPLDAVKSFGHYIPVDDVLLLGFANRADGSTQPRAAILHQNAGRWLIKQTLML